MSKKEMRDIKYPVDSANFRWIRENGYIYVDKTDYLHKLISKGKYFFLARPRRFGKSLFLDTISEYFKGSRELFKGLAIDSLQPEEWEKYPVLRLNLTGKDYCEPQSLVTHISDQLTKLGKEYSIENSSLEFEGNFDYLIQSIANKIGKKIVILIDEYDAPLSSTIGKPELQETYREQLHGFYSVLKASEEYIRFCMLTGVTRYGKVSVFSGLNNLKDITFLNEYAGICGITKEELTTYYDQGIIEFAHEKGISREEAYGLLKFNYDGYHFSASMHDIYNPFSINNALADREIKDYWCQSGVPTILSESLMRNDFKVEELAGCKVKEESLSMLSMHNLQPIPLFYQTGYLTLKDYDSRRKLYTLGYPNREVEEGILNNILNYYTGERKNDDSFIFNLQDSLIDGEPEKFIKHLSSFLSGIPVDLREDVAKYENYYHTIFYCIVDLIGLDVSAEYGTSEGYIDILIKTEKYIYVIELKVNGTAEDAIRQIEEKHYAAPFASDSRRLYKIGIGFSKTTHSITSFVIDKP